MSNAPKDATHFQPVKDGERDKPQYWKQVGDDYWFWEAHSHIWQWIGRICLPASAIPIKRDESVAYIDWSKAPERATHFVISAESRIPSGWYQRDGNKMRDLARELEYTFRLDDLHEGRAIRLVPRPTAWDGQGLPPVGTVCEYTGHKHGLKPGAHVEIIHHFNAGSADVAAFIYSQGVGMGRYVAQAVAGNFRPIRTPEQIDRDRVVGDWLEYISFEYGVEISAKLESILVGAGWRKDGKR